WIMLSLLAVCLEQLVIWGCVQFQFFCFFFLMVRPPASSTLFPYTTLFRSRRSRGASCSPAGSRCSRGSRSSASGSRGSCSRGTRSEEHTSELQSRENLVCRLLLEKKKYLYSTNNCIYTVTCFNYTSSYIEY